MIPHAPYALQNPRRQRRPHPFPLDSVSFFLVIFNWYCPLTYLEVWLRSRHDPSLTYKGSFIIYYAEKLIYVELPRYLIAISTIFLCGFNGWLYIKSGKEISLKSIFASLTF